MVLGSASPRRLELFRDLCPLDFVVRQAQGELVAEEVADPPCFALENAVYKADCLKESLAERDLLFCFDTVVSIGPKILGKPSDESEAKMFLRLLSGRVHEVHTGFCILRGRQELFRGVETTKVEFYPLSAEIIDRYVATKDSFDKAGAYGIQSKGKILIKAIHGCFYNVMGLPVPHIYHLLGENFFGS